MLELANKIASTGAITAAFSILILLIGTGMEHKRMIRLGIFLLFVGALSIFIGLIMMVWGGN